jgi:hypothetical protein
MNLSETERRELMSRQRNRKMAVGQVRRAQQILLLDEGASREAIMTWKTRFTADRLAGLYARHPGRAPRSDLARLEARVLDYTLKRKPKDGSTHWISRKLAAQLGLPFMTVQRVWRRHDLQPHRLERHMVSNDPGFETKAANMIDQRRSDPRLSPSPAITISTSLKPAASPRALT